MHWLGNKSNFGRRCMVSKFAVRVRFLGAAVWKHYSRAPQAHRQPNTSQQQDRRAIFVFTFALDLLKGEQGKHEKHTKGGTKSTTIRPRWLEWYAPGTSRLVRGLKWRRTRGSLCKSLYFCVRSHTISRPSTWSVENTPPTRYLQWIELFESKL